MYPKMETKTEIIVENDEMEDGSIFVCFMCEQEFSKVSLLNEHMQSHKNMPEMSKDLPGRKRGRGGAVGVQRGQPGRPRGQGRGRGQVSNISIAPAPVSVRVSAAPAPPQEVKYETLEVYIDPEDSNAKKAQRIRQYFQSRLMASAAKENKKRPAPFDDEDDGSLDQDALGQPLAEEEIMMVPQPSKKLSSGPMRMTGEPEGFHAPPPSIAPSSNRKVKLRKKLIVQEVVYEEVEEDDDGEETVTIINSVPLSMPMTSTKPVVRRGRPPKVVRMPEVEEFRDEIEEEEMQEEDDEEGEVIELSDDDDDDVMEFPAGSRNSFSKKPGRRTQPRGVDEGPGIPCDVCGKEFRSMTTLRVHTRAHSEVKDIPCPYCDQVFPQRHVLHQHLVNDHEQSSNLICSVCGKVFTRTDSLKSHMVRMHEEDGGLNCYICGKNFPSQGQLEMHVRVHTGERPFKCEHCNKGFVQKVHLRTHLRTMHDMQEIQNTPCRICNAMLDGRAGLRDHYNSVHGLTNNQYKSRVAKLRKEGKIPELPPPVVKEVDPSLNYYKVNVAELTAAASNTTSSISVAVSHKTGKKRSVRGRARRVSKVVDSDSSSAETTTYCDADTTYGATEVKLEVDEDSDAPKRRDQEELNIVESAFKVAEQMDQLGANIPGSTTILVAGEDSATTGVYYAIPVVMDNSTSSTTPTTTTSSIIQCAPTSSKMDAGSREAVHSITSTVTTNGTPMISTTTSDVSSLPTVHFGQEEIDDDEYAQFAAEHSHMADENFEQDDLNGKGAIVKAEPLQLFTDPGDPSQTETVEMFTM